GNLANYLRSEETTRKILRLYGPPLVGRRGTVLLIARSHAKSWAYRVGTGLGLQGALIRRRNRPLTPDETGAADAALERVRRTAVPGLDATENVAGERGGHARVGC